MRHTLFSFGEMERFGSPGEPGGDNSARRDFYRRILAEGLESSLTPKQREAMALYYGQGLSMYEVGEQLGIDPSAVSRRLTAARRRLRDFAEAVLRCCGEPRGE